MASNKYDYGDEMPQSGAMSDAEMRQSRLEQRNRSIAEEFRNLKPELTRAYMLLCALTEKSDTLSKSVSGLLELLKASFPVRLAEKDRADLQKEIDGIAGNAVSRIRAESEKVSSEIKRDMDRISVTQKTFWCGVALLLTLTSFFAVVTFADVVLLHSGILTRIILVHIGLIAITLAVIFIPFHRHKT